jgi:hypothetical protein
MRQWAAGEASVSFAAAQAEMDIWFIHHPAAALVEMPLAPPMDGCS